MTIFEPTVILEFLQIVKNLGKAMALVIIFPLVGIGQSFILKGLVKDIHSDERIPFASVQFKNSPFGAATDSAGFFRLVASQKPSDSLEISCVGYKTQIISISSLPKGHDTVTILMERARFADVVVKAKVNRGLLLWRKIVRNKPMNDRTQRFDNFSYELYNKLELDLDKVNKEKLKDVRLLRPFGFILENIDTTETKPFLPVFLAETISDYYVQYNPPRYREVIKATRTSGVDNESASKLMGGMYQNVNVYSNYIPVFDKQFVSPISDNGDAYYKYRLADTQFISGRRFLHLIFMPKRPGENTFEGDCWVHDTSFAIQKMNLRLSKEADINFVENISLIQEFRLINDSTWFLSRDKFVVNIYPVGKNKFGFIGRKTTTYRNVVVNSPDITARLSGNKIRDVIELSGDARDKADSFWRNSRHEDLSRNEKAIYAMIDTLQKMPLFRKYTNVLNFLGTGYLNWGNYQIGPWFNWVSGNNYEGMRFRFDLGTNHHFNKKIWLHGYLAYGLTDRRWKGKAEAFYLPSKNPRTYIYGSYSNDLDYDQSYYDEISSDNIFALAVRKPNVPIKFMNVEEQRLEFYRETGFGLSGLLSLVHRRYDPLRNLPDKRFFLGGSENPLSNFEVSFRLRFAYLEKFLENHFFRSSLGSDFPIAEVRFAKGVTGVMKSSYNYNRVSAGISDYLRVPPYGSLYYNVFAGQIFSQDPLPYMLLEMHPGNEMYYYNKYAFNMMNRYEFISDRYAGFNLEHNIGNGLFRFIPLTRRLKFRQFWSAKGVVGTLGSTNRNLNFVGDYPFQSLDKKLYMELGTGVDNIFRVLRVDFIWRVLPRPLPPDKARRFGIFGSFRLTF